MSTTPCTWPVDAHCLPAESSTNPEARRDAVSTAITVLWALTGRQYGVCATTVRPCPPQGTGRDTDTMPQRATSGVCGTPACGRDNGILLPGPVHQITRFTVYGTPVDLSSLTLHGDTVYRAHNQPWPPQNLHLVDGQPGTFSIDYLRGTPPPPGADHAVGVLAAEFHAACHGGRCRLPRRTRQVERQGVTVTMIDPEDIYAHGATGIPEVDLWIRAVNPHKLAEPSTVWSPDQGVW